MEYDGQHIDTDKFLAIRYKHLDKSWLDKVNEMVGWLKQHLSGNGEMRVFWSGGVPQTEWTLHTKGVPQVPDGAFQKKQARKK